MQFLKSYLLKSHSQTGQRFFDYNSGRVIFCISTEFSERSALEKFCVDLTARASGGLIDPVIGRDTEFQRVIQILCRRTKNNPILLGESGVGKTAIAEGLAISIVHADVPFFLLVCYNSSTSVLIQMNLVTFSFKKNVLCY
jgi:ATP-dependent Clp protease ATP-binding subunit ClpA